MPHANGVPTQEDVDFFNTNGYWISPKIISDERLEKLRDRMERVYQGEFETGTAPDAVWSRETSRPNSLRKTDNANLSDLTIRALAHDSQIGQIAAALKGTNTIRFWEDQLLLKPAQSSGNAANVGWHQDYHYWGCFQNPETMITAWVAYDDVDLDNGCMQMVPGSHNWGILNGNDFYEQNMQKQLQDMAPEGQIARTVPIIMKAGQISFHHSLTIHGSGPNISDRVRRSSALHYLTAETRYRAGFADEYSEIKKFIAAGGKDGDIVQGDMFPIVYSRT
ncbi:phytanoyl-CoA dioxygenase family protein [Paenibacillus sp. OV219]|uniref:phytanoyl-CoA dioxygenase family protein n=1 Tax=Paenibacillus sp. OV219 TaxID=1884377 RepID=UPI0008B77B92|nr:phytanoyl-CoA dioxygenase family protein [Paenibacillus sp. OV219]SEO89164.1 Ectoine hydroxylase-related dioxygenase, phytanoyl-CoA dioxygenase (PhyH) family [Paenibacillus sp. OV219]